MPILILFLLLFIPLSAEEKKTICLNMIVKNEAHVIRRCLASVQPIIDHWVIVDTGSTDGTQEIIKEFMKEIPGELYERPWKNFEHNRNEALELAKNKGDYFLIMDADDRLEFDPTFTLPKLDRDSYRVWIKYGGTSYQRHQLLASKMPWKWVGVLHEVLMCDAPFTTEVLEGVTYIVTCDGARSQDQKKFYKDAAILEDALKKEPNNTRYMFYLAQSYRDAGEYEKSIEWYQKRISKGGWIAELFWSVLQVALCQEILGKPDDIIIDNLLWAHRLAQHRPEPIFYLAQIFRKQKKYELAYALILFHERTPKKPTKDILFFQDWCKDYGLLCEFSISSYYMGRFQESLDACEKLLAMKDLPDYLRQQVEANKRLALAMLHKESQSSTSTTTDELEPGWAAG